jgi:hypothetical protein
MNPSEVRGELLEQHAKLRGMIGEVRRAVRCAHESEAMRRELGACIAGLSLALRMHNHREEELLRGILVTVDAWGPVRAEIMSEQHVAEHVELCGVLLDANVTSHRAVRDGVLDAGLDRVLEHMAREEIAFLGEDVLRDDSVVVQQFSG